MDPVLIVLLVIDGLLLISCIITLIQRVKRSKKADYVTAETVQDGGEEKAEEQTSAEPEQAESESVPQQESVAETPSQEENSAERDIKAEETAAQSEEKAEGQTSAEPEQAESESVPRQESVAETPSQEERSDGTAAASAGKAEPISPAGKKPFVDAPKKTADPFYIKMLNADEETQGYYNEIRNEFKAYKGVTARISKGYDSFRKNRQLVARILLSGKTIRLYLRLNAGDYENNKFHQQYVGDKKTYAEIPMLVKIKSKRGLANAKLLVADLMKQEGAVKKTRLTKVDYIETLKALKEND